MDRFFRLLIVACLWSGLVFFVPRPALAGGVVTDCESDAELIKRLAAGGLVSFDCGAAVIPLSATQIIDVDTTIDAGGLVTLSGQSARRLFVVSTGKTLTLQNITLIDGFADGDGGAITNFGNLVLDTAVIRGSSVTAGRNGGAIASYGPITITHSSLSGNVAGNGGALYLRYDTATAVLVDSTLEANQAVNLNDGWGGAVLLADGADLSARGGLFSSNQARQGGAIYTHSFGSKVTLLGDALLRGNQAHYGGAFYIVNGALDLSGASVQENRASYSGGGGYLESAWASIDQADFSRNRSQQAGYQSYGFGGGLTVSANTGYLSLTRSLFKENVAFYGAGIYLDNARPVWLVATQISGNQARGAGGGMYLEPGSGITMTASLLDNNLAAGNGGGAYIDSDADFVMENVTLSGNQAQVTGGGVVNYGRLTLRHVTLYENAAPVAASLYYSTLAGASRASLTLQNTVLAGGVDGSNCFLGKAIDEATYSMASDETCRLFGTGNSNGQPVLFTPLRDNGGPTLTHLPLPGSPVIDSGQCLPGLVTDQRGKSRQAVGENCDIGATEASWDFQVYIPAVMTSP